MDRFLDIIIPEYNCEPALMERLLKSISKQKNVNFKDIGLLIINDHSPKKLSKTIFNKFPKLKIKYILKKENSGTGLTRQYGLDLSEATYVTFVDQDDILYGDDSLGKVIESLKKHYSNVVVTNYYEEYSDDSNQLKLHPHRADDYDALHGLFISRKYLKDNGIKFSQNVRTHDDAFFRKVLFAFGDADYFDIFTYVWKKNDNSITKKKRKYHYLVETYDDLSKAICEAIDFLNERHIDIKEYTVSSLFGQFFILESNYFDYDDLKEKKIEGEKRLYEYYLKHKMVIDEFKYKINDIYEKQLRVYYTYFENFKILESLDNYLDRMKKLYPAEKLEERKQYFLDIIVPQYKQTEEQLTNLLDSIYRQNGIDFDELCVTFVNDCSNDEPSTELFCKYNKLNIKYLKNSLNLGQGLARQYGIDDSTAKYVTFVDQDDELYGDDSLAGVIKALKSDTSINALYTNFEEEYYVGNDRKVFLHKDDLYLYLHGLFLNREYLNAGGYRFHSRLRTYEDVYFCANVAFSSKCRYIDTCTYVWKDNKNSIMRTIDDTFLPETFDDFFTACVDSYFFLKGKKSNRAAENLINSIFGMIDILGSNYFMNPLYSKKKDIYDLKVFNLLVRENHIFDGFTNEQLVQMANDEYDTLKMRYPNLEIIESYQQFVNRMQRNGA